VRRGSLWTRLVAGTLVWLLLALGAGGLALSWAFRRAAETAFDQRLDALALAIVATLEPGADGGVRLARPVPEPTFERVFSGWYWQVDAGGTPLRSRSLWDQVLPDAGPGPRGEALRRVRREVTLPGVAQPVRIVVAADGADVAREAARFDRLLLVSLGLLGVGLVIAVVVQVGYGLRPLRRMGRELAAVQAGRKARLADDYPREIAPLAEAMNAVLDHDAEQIARARTHVGNLAHALKTPLAVLSAELERQGGSAAARTPVATIDRLVQHHLARAAAAGPTRGPAPRTPVASVAHAVADAVGRMHAGRRLTIDVDVPADLTLPVERQDLEEMLGNLVDNAGKWARGRIRVQAARGAAGVEVDVDDDGPGLPPELAPAALARGARLDESRPGSGLGLAIVSDLAALYGATVALESAPLGGLRVALRWPAA
jgi:signal transduction histidine kinase